VGTVPPFTIVLLLESLLRPTAKGIVSVLCAWLALTSDRISIEAAVFLSAGPAPRLSAALPHVEFILVIESAGKHIVACRILQSPAAAPGTALGISRP